LKTVLKKKRKTSQKEVKRLKKVKNRLETGKKR